MKVEKSHFWSGKTFNFQTQEMKCGGGGLPSWDLLPSVRDVGSLLGVWRLAFPSRGWGFACLSSG